MITLTMAISGNTFDEIFGHFEALQTAGLNGLKMEIPRPAPSAPAQNTAESAPIPAAGPLTTAAPAYTLEQLARAGAVLAQTGKTDQALALLAKYGVQSVHLLKPEQYGAFAADLRALGAAL